MRANGFCNQLHLKLRRVLRRITSKTTFRNIFFTLYTQRNIFGILLNQPEIKSHSPFSDWIGTKRKSVWFQVNRKVIITIWCRVDLIRLRKYFSVCTRRDLEFYLFLKWTESLITVYDIQFYGYYFELNFASYWCYKSMGYKQIQSFFVTFYKKRKLVSAPYVIKHTHTERNLFGFFLISTEFGL